MRQKNANYLSSHISKHEEIETPSPKSGSDHIYQMYTIKLKDTIMRDNLHSFLTTKRIFSKIYFSPIHLTKFYMKKFNTTKGMLPVTEEISSRILTLPMFPSMTNEEKELIIMAIDEFFELDSQKKFISYGISREPDIPSMKTSFCISFELYKNL